MRIASWHYYVVEVILFFLIIFGTVPRWFAFVLAAFLILYTLLSSLEDATVMFVRSIPLFIALPITQSFDNMNTWRIIALIIFLRWFFTNSPQPSLIDKRGSKLKMLLPLSIRGGREELLGGGRGSYTLRCSMA